MIGEPKIKERKVIQIACAAYQGFGIVVLCDDGTMWTNDECIPLATNDSRWIRINKIPDDKSKFYEDDKD